MAVEYVRCEFKRLANVSQRDVTHIEYLLRKGRKQLEWFRAQNVTSISGWKPPINR